MLERFLGMFRKNKTARADGDFLSIPSEVEVRLIKHYLEKKFGHEFKARVKVDGYIDKPEYRLVLNDFGSTDMPSRVHTVWGDTVRDVLGLNYGFVNAYWRNVERGINAELSDAALSKFDLEIMEGYRETAVAGSRSEMILRATAEGLL